MITPSGILCDVCGKYILPIVHDEAKQFMIKGQDVPFHAHSEHINRDCEKVDCFEIVQNAIATKDYSGFDPDSTLGRIARVIEAHNKLVDATK